MPGEGFESLLSSDYSQVELRIMADLSGDEALIEAFRSGRIFISMWRVWCMAFLWMRLRLISAVMLRR